MGDRNFKVAQGITNYEHVKNKKLKCLLVAAMQYSQEEVLHYFMILLPVTVWQETGSKHYNGIHSVAIVT